jgi:predicted lysophospholipase L1 biosynthesis ABC-type transport system permease subunit
MASLDNAASGVQKFLSVLMGGALLAFVAFGVVAKGPAWYANRKAEAARGGPGLNLSKIDGGGPRTYLRSETTVDYTPNAKIIRTKTWQVNEPATRR